jgi:osmotically-inducible protein OsmY
MSDDLLQASVADELHFDPKVDSDAIAVATEDGTVTLRGTVGSFREKREAQNAAERVYGVEHVKNELKVRILTKSGKKDADLRGDVLQAMLLDSLVPSTIDVTVADGWVTLSGTADWQYQRQEAESVAGNVPGVVGVDDYIELNTPEPDAGDVQHSIEKAFKRSAKIDAGGLTVVTHDNTVELRGTVRSWSEHDAALATAWAAPGVLEVRDGIRVAY